MQSWLGRRLLASPEKSHSERWSALASGSSRSPSTITSWMSTPHCARPSVPPLYSPVSRDCCSARLCTRLVLPDPLAPSSAALMPWYTFTLAFASWKKCTIERMPLSHTSCGGKTSGLPDRKSCCAVSQSSFFSTAFDTILILLRAKSRLSVSSRRLSGNLTSRLSDRSMDASGDLPWPRLGITPMRDIWLLFAFSTSIRGNMNISTGSVDSRLLDMSMSLKLRMSCTVLEISFR